ncbi:geranylgeranyl reductase family protein [Thermoplasmatales archaeon SCGC AB-539-N05]|nr:geranylgeranyl reductase family protein [Thermoplasmatales archaeon SCGC AB-539-N05]
MFDLVVVGGNLSGVTAAINAAEKGLKVALVEKNKHPLNPPHCGEGLLEPVGDLLGLFETNCHKNRVNKLIINVASPEEYVINLKKYFLVIFDRNHVENDLLKTAEKLGVELYLGVKMKDFIPPNEVIIDNKKISGKIIIDASGIACEVGRRVGLKTKIKKENIGVCIQSRVAGKFESNTVKIWFHKPYAPFGYAWLFPINENLANIGIGIRGRQNIDLNTSLKHFIKDTVKGSYKLTSTFKSCVPADLPLNQLYKENIMITGDAARLVDTFAAGGIRNAVLSGKLAGKVAAKYIKGEITSLKPYQDVMSSIINNLIKFYSKTSYTLKSEEIYLKEYRKAIKFLSIIHSIAPSFLEKFLIRAFIKDIKIIESYD